MATAKCDEGAKLLAGGKTEEGKRAHAQCVLSARDCVCKCHRNPEINQLRMRLLKDGK